MQTLIGSFTGGKAGGLIKDQATAIQTNLNSTVPLQNLMSNQPGNGNADAPRGFLNYVFFDEQFNFVGESSGAIRVSQAGDGAPAIIAPGLKAPKNGYVFVYVSNGSTEAVYFDNFAVSHERGRLIEENHYYAHGLKIAAISSKSVSTSLNVKMTNYGYQGIFSEEVTEFELNYNEFELRTYDPQIGRWTTPDPYDEFASPYLGMGNDPANHVDPDGGSIANIGSAIWSFLGGVGGFGCSSTVGMVGYGAAPGLSTLSSFSISFSQGASYFLLGLGSAGDAINVSLAARIGRNEGGKQQLDKVATDGDPSDGTPIVESKYWILYTGEEVVVYEGEYGDTGNEYFRLKGTSGGQNNQVASDQQKGDKGPVPEGDYSIDLSLDPSRAVEMTNGGLTSRQSGVTRMLNPNNYGNLLWGRWRAKLDRVNVNTKREDNFYMHDSYKGFSHGCIETESSLYYFFFSEHSQGVSTIKVKVDYKNGSTTTNGGTKDIPLSLPENVKALIRKYDPLPKGPVKQVPWLPWPVDKSYRFVPRFFPIKTYSGIK